MFIMDKVKIGIIGTGSISNVHIQGYKKLPNVEIVAACDINEERVKAAAEKYDIPNVFTDYNEMLNSVELDGVSVCTWNNAHAPASIAALKAGVNVLCEKPMAMNAEEAEEMLKVAEESGKLLMIGFVKRFEEKTAAVKRFIERGELGEVYYGKIGYTRRRGNPGGWFSNKELSGGGPLIDLGVHVIDQVRYVMGKPKAVSAYGATFDKIASRTDIDPTGEYVAADHSKSGEFINNVEDSAIGVIKFDNGATIFIETSWVQHVKEGQTYLELYGSHAGISLEPKLQIAGDKDEFMVNWEPVFTPNDGFGIIFDRETAHFVECIQKGIPCRCPAEDGLEVMKILDAIYKSAETGKEIDIK